MRSLTKTPGVMEKGGGKDKERYQTVTPVREERGEGRGDAREQS